MSDAIKHDDGKPPMHLVPRDAIESIARGLGYGAKKYSAHQWRQGMAWSRSYAALMRHAMAWWDGEDIDPESGLSHLDHILCNASFLATYNAKGLGQDDRYKGEKA